VKLDHLKRRIDGLEDRMPPVKSDTKKILEKCTDDELRRLEAITGKNEDLTEEEIQFLADLEARYRPGGKLGE
jgi:hypothetical protein